IEAPLLLGDGVDVQVRCSGVTAEIYAEIYAKAACGGEWIRHATATLTAEPGPAPEPVPDVDGEAYGPAEELYADLAAAGLTYGPAFGGRRRAWPVGDAVHAEIRIDASTESYGMHPALLDAAIHAIAYTDSDDDATVARVPFAWSGVTVHRRGAQALTVRVIRRGPDTYALTGVDE